MSELSRPEGQKDVLLLQAAPIPLVRIGVIGLGNRALRSVNRLSDIPGAQIVALCDLIPERVSQAQEILIQHSHPKATEYTTPEGWKELCKRDDVDLVYICTDWKNHTPMAVYAMNSGKHAAVEVPAATTIDECWQLVDTAEKTQRHCMMLENCCYDLFELTTLNMVQKGLFGEIIHGEGAYIHDLRSLLFADENKGGFYDYWQKKYSLAHDGNPYPTHGLGPVCQAMNIHRGDKMNYLVSMSSKQAGMTEYAVEHFGKDSEEAQNKYILGDMNNTLIRTEKGRTILLQHNRVSPRPYTRIHLINGTKGYFQKYPVEQMIFEGGENSLTQEEIDQLLAEHEHPFITELGKTAVEHEGIRARDYIMDYRLIHCLRNGLPLDQDVYDAAEWSCIVELSEQSVFSGSMPVQIPDFTRGLWNKLDKLEFSSLTPNP